MSRLRSSRLVRATAVLVAATLVLAACSEREDGRDEVLDAIDATERLSHRFVYTEESRGRGAVEVVGLVEDDFRYKAQLAVGGVPTFEQVVDDDDVAVRMLDPAQLVDFLDQEVLDVVETATDVEGVSVLDALEARRWVLDVGGAPSVVVSADELEERGDNPVVDARTLFTYVRRVTNAIPPIQFNPDSISPTYRKGEDPFPRPGPGEVRYDYPLLPLPTVAQALAGSGVPIFPGTGHFRKMAVYVDSEGRIARIIEVVDVTGKRLDELRDYSRRLVEETAPAGIVEAFKAEVDRLEGAALADFLVEGLNTFLELSGEDPVRLRSMTYELVDLDADDVVVEMPGDTIKGSLALIRDLGRKPFVEPDDEEPTGGGGAATDGAEGAGAEGADLASEGDAGEAPAVVSG